MTENEAIKMLKSKMDGHTDTSYEWAETVRMAINALERASCIKEKCAYCPHCEHCDVDDETLAIKALEPSKDCISRAEAIKETKTLLRGNYDHEYIIETLKMLPSVTPKAEQKAVLDKIRAEIEQLTSRYSISKERGGMGQVEWSDRLIEESDVLQIIDKYKAESEG